MNHQNNDKFDKCKDISKKMNYKHNEIEEHEHDSDGDFGNDSKIDLDYVPEFDDLFCRML